MLDSNRQSTNDLCRTDDSRHSEVLDKVCIKWISLAGLKLLNKSNAHLI